MVTKSAAIVFPHQLFESNPSLDKIKRVYVVEEFLFFNQYKFHKQKILFHRASMKFYEDYLKKKNYDVEYIDSFNPLSDIRKLILHLKKSDVEEVCFIDPVDNWLNKRIIESSRKAGIKTVEYPTPTFINTRKENEEYFLQKKKFFQTDFYIKQRKKLGILLDNNGEPVGGKWSFDTANRLKYPADKKAPLIKHPEFNSYYKEAAEYVKKYFPDNYGEINDRFVYPVTFNESKKWLDQFLKKRFTEFGLYEDAIVSHESILNHSVLTPMLNSGLLTPDYVVSRTLDYARENKTPINSAEGFIRQIIGWREFIRGVYEIKGSYQRTNNFWGFERKIPKSFWNGTTGIEPIDTTIKKVLDTGYAHHIERLMVLGNFMLICEFDPDEVYRWFMEMFIDAYDWVMVPNVYGMSQFADGGLIATKPYISGSNYLMKMSNYKKADWQKIWDGLFWRFMDKHRKILQKNVRLSMLIKTFDKMPEDRKKQLWNSAANFLNKL